MSACTKCGEPAAHILVTVPFQRDFPITVRHRCPGCDTTFEEDARDLALALTAALRGTGLVVLREDEVHGHSQGEQHPAHDGSRVEERLEDEKSAGGDPGKAEATTQDGDVGSHAPATPPVPQEAHGSGPCPFIRDAADGSGSWACHAPQGQVAHQEPPNARGTGPWRLPA